MNLKEITKLYDLTNLTVVITGGAGVLGSEMACAWWAGCERCHPRPPNQPSPTRDPTHRAPGAPCQAGNGSGLASAVPPSSICDVLQRDSLVQAREMILGEFGGIYGLINAAGGNRPTATTSSDLSFFDLSESALRGVFDLNLLGTMLPSQVSGKPWRRPEWASSSTSPP